MDQKDRNNAYDERDRAQSDDGHERRAETEEGEMLSSDMLFPWKLHEMLEDLEKSGRQHIASWLSGGRAFKIHARREFESLLPRYFKHSSLKSFQRQLSLYGFTRSRLNGHTKGSYSHELFVREDRHLSRLISTRSNSEATEFQGPTLVGNPVMDAIQNVRTFASYGSFQQAIPSVSLVQSVGLNVAQNTRLLERQMDTPNLPLHIDPQLQDSATLPDNNAAKKSNILQDGQQPMRQRESVVETARWLLDRGLSVKSIRWLYGLVGERGRAQGRFTDILLEHSDDIISLFNSEDS